MKKILGILALLFVLCVPAAHAGDSPRVYGLIYANTTTPGDGYSTLAPSKVGSANCKSIFGLVAVGNCSVRQAMKNGGISSLSFYDMQVENILGIMTITTKAYGK